MDFQSAAFSGSSDISPSSLTTQRKAQDPGTSSLLSILLGDVRPLRGLHTVEEVGGSIWLRTEILLLYRLSATSALVFGVVLFSATGGMPPATFGAWAFYLTMIAMVLATVVSLRYLVAPERAVTTDCRDTSCVLADLAVPFMQTAVTLEIIVTAPYWAVVRLDQGPPRTGARAACCGSLALVFRRTLRI